MEAGNTVIIDAQILKRAYKKIWRDKNKESIKQYRLDYLKEHNSDTICSICNGCYKKYGLSLHKTTKKHITQLKILEMEEKIKTLEAAQITLEVP